MSGGFSLFTALSVLSRAPTPATALGPARSASPSSTIRRSRAPRPACRICAWPCGAACAGPRVGLEDRLDPGPVALQGRPVAGRGHRSGRRHVLHVGVLGDGVAAQPEPPGYLRPRDAVGVHRAYLVSRVLGHGHLPRPSRRALRKTAPGRRYAEGRPRPCGERPSCPDCSVFDDHGAQKAVTIRTTS